MMDGKFPVRFKGAAEEKCFENHARCPARDDAHDDVGADSKRPNAENSNVEEKQGELDKHEGECPAELDSH